MTAKSIRRKVFQVAKTMGVCLEASFEEDIDCGHVVDIMVGDCVQWHKSLTIEHKRDRLAFLDPLLRLVGTRDVGECGILKA